MSAVEINAKSAGPAGATIAPGARGLAKPTWKVSLVPFMLEDYVDSVLAKQALEDPENKQQPISWEHLKEQLGL